MWINKMEKEGINLLKEYLNYIDYTRFEFGENLDKTNLEKRISLFLKKYKDINIK